MRPQLSLCLRASLNVHELLEVGGTHTQLPPPVPAKPSAMSNLSLWQIDTYFKFKVVSATNVNAGDDMKVMYYYHGSHYLGVPRKHLEFCNFPPGS